MDERTTLEIIAPTVEEALAQGLTQLGLPADAVTVEVLDTGSKGIFGLGGRQVRVRLIVNTLSKESDEPASPEKPTLPSKVEPVSEGQPKPPAHEIDRLINITEDVVSKLLHYLGLQAQVSAHYGTSDREESPPVCVDIRGDDLGVLIGRRSETLNAFQYLTGLIVSNEMEQWVRLIIDVEGYRTRREHQLRLMARRMTDQVIKTGRRHVLEPMPANERRIIHIELHDHPQVTTESVGEEPNRKVTIIPKE